MAKTLTLKREAECADCGATLPAGTRARYYNPRHIYGLDCHEDKRTNGNGYNGGNSVQERSRLDPTGFYNAAGELMGRTNANGRCEDAPCCGCCT